MEFFCYHTLSKASSAYTGGSRQARKSLASNSRRLCNMSALQAPVVFQPLSGRDGSGHGCSHTRVAHTMHICIPTGASYKESPAQADLLKQLHWYKPYQNLQARSLVAWRMSGDGPILEAFHQGWGIELPPL